MMAALGLDDAAWPADAAAALDGAAGRRSPSPCPTVLFAKIDDARRAELEARFAGRDAPD